MRRSYLNQAKANDQHIHGQQEVRRFGEQWALIINVGCLVGRSTDWHITAPLVGYYPVVHGATNNAQYLRIAEELWSEAGRLKWHREEMAMRTAVRLLAMALQVIKQNRPKRRSTSAD